MENVQVCLSLDLACARCGHMPCELQVEMPTDLSGAPREVEGEAEVVCHGCGQNVIYGVVPVQLREPS